MLGGVAAAGGLLAVCTLAGLGLGVIIGHTAGAIAALIGLIYLLAAMCLVLPSPWNDRIGRFAIAFATYQVLALHRQPGLLSPALPMLVLIGWPAVVLLIAAVLLTRRGARRGRRARRRGAAAAGSWPPG